MSKESSNPFVLPGFGQDGEAARNPLFASLEMMRQAWQGVAGGGSAPTAFPVLSIEDLDRRISELRAVQNWLQLNATMLGNTIQGLEIQRATLSTLQSFADRAAPDAAAPSAARHETAGKAAQARSTSAGQADADAPDTAAAEDTAAISAEASRAYTQAAGEWWNMLQQQFQSLADATTSTLQAGAEPAQASARPAASGGASVPRKTARKSTTSAAKAAGTRSTRKSAASKPRSSKT